MKIICDICGKDDFTNKQQLGGHKGYCSGSKRRAMPKMKRTIAERTQEKRILWQKGEGPPPKKGSGVKHWFSILKEQKCEKCSWKLFHPVSSNNLVQMHHKDGNNKNQSYSNLQWLCPNCHALTDNFGNHGGGGVTGSTYGCDP